MISTTRRSLFAAVSGGAMAARSAVKRMTTSGENIAGAVASPNWPMTAYDQIPKAISERELAWNHLRNLRQQIREVEERGPLFDQRNVLGYSHPDIECLKSISNGQRIRMIDRQNTLNQHRDHIRLLRAEIAQHLKTWAGLA